MEVPTETGEPCGASSCAASEHCELVPLACPPNEVCAAVMEEACLPNDGGDQSGGSDGGDQDGGDQDDGDEDGEV